MSAKSIALTVQKWGNSLAIRLPAKMARNAHIQIGTSVVLTAQNEGILIHPTEQPNLTLDERLALFDVEKHGGEVFADKLIGREKI